MLNLIRNTAESFAEHDCMRMAAAIAYYALFSLPPLLVISITLASYLANLAQVADNGRAQQLVQREVTQSLGVGAAEQVDQMIEHASRAPRSTLGLIIGAAVFFFGASGVMVQLQASINEVWTVKPDPKRGGIKNFLLKRVLSFAMVLGVSFLLLISMLLSTILSSVGDQVAKLLSADITEAALHVISLGVNLVFATLIFAAMFKWLADVEVAWRDVWIGAGTTALLFIAGKSALTFYFATVDLGSTYGAAGSMALILTWVYYSALIFLFGAEFTRAVTLHRHGEITPQSGAVAVETIVREA